VMHSADGNSWDSIGQVGFRQGVEDYSFVDGSPLNGANYYRLQLVGAGGNSMWSPVREVVFGATGTSSVRLFPNPAADQVFISSPGLSLDGTMIQLYSVAGALVPVSVTGGLGLATVDVAGLAAGVYFLRVKTTMGWQVLRLFIHK
jgi:hypothetical protein